MFELITIIVCVVILILLKFCLNINLKEIGKLKNKTSKDLENLSIKFPNDYQICNDILNKFDIKGVKIEINQEYTSCLYTVFNNAITIGKFKQDYMKIQTIAHECIHSSQDKKTLWSNFIFTNIYLIYFIAILILESLNYLPYKNIHILILIFLSFFQYIIRYSLEVDALTRAKYVAKEYIEEENILKKDEKEKLLKEYDEINEIGIPFMNFNLITTNIIKIILFCIVVLV